MKYFFSLRIDAIPEQISKITNILGVEPNYPQVAWGFKLDVKENIYSNFIECLLGIVDGKFDELHNIGVKREDISIWMIYEYVEQCNMEFSPSQMKRLGDSGITFCISCYQNAQS